MTTRRQYYRQIDHKLTEMLATLSDLSTQGTLTFPATF